MGNDITVA
jgi:hypothetical protein